MKRKPNLKAKNINGTDCIESQLYDTQASENANTRSTYFLRSSTRKSS